MLIRNEDKINLVSRIFKGKGRRHQLIQGLTLSASLAPDTLLYSWGSAKNGKLGISNNYFSDLIDGENHTQFYKGAEDDQEAA
jgi:alpha-tubulin suppressor-like RCC1 family protein